MDMGEMQRLIDLGEKNGLAELEVEKSGVRVRIKYTRDNPMAPAASPATLVHASSTPVASSASQPATAAAPPVETPSWEEDKDVFLVKSPIVGTFYGAADPQSPPFVKVGDRVKVGQVLCIVEAMKLMNEIESDVAGEIIKVFVQNAQPVEYSENLFAIRTHS